MTPQSIENHGVIGDMNTVALVGLDGALDFMCYPEFDSPSVFAGLLDAEKGGYFGLAPDFDGGRRQQLYVPETNVLLTRFMSQKGILEITDFMPVKDDPDQPGRVVRMAKAIRGEIPVRMICAPAFDYARRGHEVNIEKGGYVAAFSDGPGGNPTMRLHSSEKLENQAGSGSVNATFTLKTDEQAVFILNCGGEKEDCSHERVEGLYRDTLRYWRDWVSRITYDGRWQETVIRSALLLKLLTSRRHGSIVAAPTFALPEAVGGHRNWDYRYCWIRDSAFTIYAFMRLGLKEEAIAFIRWIDKLYDRRKEDHGELQLMYRLDGTGDLEEKTLGHLDGYRGSRPVRIGNAAAEQFQLDLYGELLDCVALSNAHITKVSHDTWEDLTRTVEFVCENWQRPDAGIWEFRGEKREFLHSRLMCWVAIDRALRLAHAESLPAPSDRWQEVQGQIYHDIFRNFWDEERQTFVQHKETRALDAATLMMPLVDFIGPHDRRWTSTLKAIGEDLACDALVHRYRVEDIDLQPADSSREGSFNACSFWYIACLARSGQTEKAELLFNKMTGYANHLGLFAEETDLEGRQLGNFPQAFTHLALVNAAIALSEAGRTERAPTQ